MHISLLLNVSVSVQLPQVGWVANYRSLCECVGIHLKSQRSVFTIYNYLLSKLKSISFSTLSSPPDGNGMVFKWSSEDNLEGRQGFGCLQYTQRSLLRQVATEEKHDVRVCGRVLGCTQTSLSRGKTQSQPAITYFS